MRRQIAISATLFFLGSLSLTGCSEYATPESDTAEQANPSLPTKFVAGKAVYDAGCSSCHDSSREGAPRLGYLAAWSRRLAQGEEVLIEHAIEGLDLMPPRGDNPELTDNEVAQAVKYMIYRAELDIPARP